MDRKWRAYAGCITTKKDVKILTPFPKMIGFFKSLKKLQMKLAKRERNLNINSFKMGKSLEGLKAFLNIPFC